MLPKLRLTVWASLVTAICWLVLADTVFADEGKVKESLANTLSPSFRLLKAEAIDGTDFIEKMQKWAESYNDYTFKYKMTVYRGKKVIMEGGALSFKKTKLMRLEVTSGERAGSVAVLEKNGKVKGRMGGVLKLFIVNLPLESNLLKSPNGYPFADSDFASIAKETNNFLTLGCKSLVSKNPVSVPIPSEAQPGKVYILEVFRGGTEGELYKLAYIDSRYMVPVEWFDYEDGKVLAHTVWYEFKPNQGLSDKVFTVRGGK